MTTKNAAAPDGALRGRVAILTGGGRGIGRGGALGLARRGARVAVLDVTTDELDHTVSLVRAEGGEAVGVRTDLRDRSAIDRALADVTARWGVPDVLVNNAAVLREVPFEETTPEVWDETLAVNLHAGYHLAWRLYPAMIAARRGTIVAVSSRAGMQPFSLETAYCAAKYAVEGLYRSLAIEAESHGVLVTLCTPGRTTKPTSLTDAEFAAWPESRRQRYVPPETFAEGFGYLAGATDLRLSGRRMDLNALGEVVRDRGWHVPAADAIRRAERVG
jgi:NAD(P)-dependent dehydrogenase (short-subunit alcohol dehydrogenase family)